MSKFLRRRFRRCNIAEAIGRGQVAIRHVAGHQLRWLVTNPGDEIQNNQIRDGLYEKNTLLRIKNIVGTATHIFDIGANIGNHSVFFAKCFPARRIVPVEPFPEAIRHLTVNFALNPSQAYDFRYLGYGISDCLGKASICPPSEFNIGLTSLRQDSAGEVDLITGDEIIGAQEVDFIKIDVEGMEVEVLKGLNSTLKNQRPAIFIEIADSKKAACTNILDDFGYVCVFSEKNYPAMANYLFRYYR